RQYGTDRPLPERYGRWVLALARGDFGYSTSYHQTVGSLLWIRARNTLLLTALAMFAAWAVALPWGVLEALYRDKWVDLGGALVTAALLAVPDALLALLSLLLAARTGWFPTGGMTSPNASDMPFGARVWDLLIHLVLPAAVLALGAVPVLVRHVRSAVAGVLDSAFVSAAKGHGIPTGRLLYRHALPAAINPLISLFGFSIVPLICFSLIVLI